MTDPPDLGRRGFFRSFAKTAVETAGAAIGTASALNQAAREAATATLNPAPVPAEPAPTIDIARRGPAFRVDHDVLFVVDETRLPDEQVEIECRSPADLTREIGRMALPPGSAVGPAAAMSLALAAADMRGYEPTIRRAMLQVGALALINARVTSQHLRSAVERVMRVLETRTDAGVDGDGIAAAMRFEAEAIDTQRLAADSRIAALLTGQLPPETGERPTAILTHGVVALPSERTLLAHVMEGRPGLRGARVTGPDLASAGIHHFVIVDAAAGWLLASGRIDAVIVGAERIAANGDVINDLGTYPLAVLAAHSGVPFYVAAAAAVVDPGSADGRESFTRQRDAGTIGVVPVCDITPADLITAIVSENGSHRAAFESTWATSEDPPPAGQAVRAS